MGPKQIRCRKGEDRMVRGGENLNAGATWRRGVMWGGKGVRFTIKPKGLSASSSPGGWRWQGRKLDTRERKLPLPHLNFSCGGSRRGEVTENGGRGLPRMCVSTRERKVRLYTGKGRPSGARRKEEKRLNAKKQVFLFRAE